MKVSSCKLYQLEGYVKIFCYYLNSVANVKCNNMSIYQNVSITFKPTLNHINTDFSFMPV